MPVYRQKGAAVARYGTVRCWMEIQNSMEWTSNAFPTARQARTGLVVSLSASRCKCYAKRIFDAVLLTVLRYGDAKLMTMEKCSATNK